MSHCYRSLGSEIFGSLTGGVGVCRETGGDGIYINTAWDVTLSRILIDGGYRNGISVIAVQNLLVEHSIVRNTLGTDPEAVSRSDAAAFGCSLSLS